MPSILKIAREAVEKVWRPALQTVHEKRQEIAAAIAALDQEESALLTDAAPVTEVIENLEALVAAEERAERESTMALVREAGGRIDSFPGRADVLIAPQFTPEVARVVRDLLRVGVEQKTIVAGLIRSVHALGAYPAGRPMPVRIPRLAQIRAEARPALEREDAQIVDEAEGLGIHLEHLPGERGRRTVAGQKAQRERADAMLNLPMRRREAQRRGEAPPLA